MAGCCEKHLVTQLIYSLSNAANGASIPYFLLEALATTNSRRNSIESFDDATYYASTGDTLISSGFKVSVRLAASTVRFGGQEILIICPQTRNEYINLTNRIQLNWII